VHGSVDWFWELPALTGPALGFLGMAGALAEPRNSTDTVPARTTRLGQIAPAVVGSLLVVAAVLALAFPYLSVRAVSQASDVAARDPLAALRSLDRASKLNPLSAVPGRLGGRLALELRRYEDAERRFRQSIDREPGGWFSWLGDGLAASMLGDRTRARHDFEVAASIQKRQPAISQALARVDSAHPLSPAEALGNLVIAH
jgi:tetratricopeptide (TPR) repeat protein